MKFWQLTLSLLLLASELSARDIFRELMRDSIATFSDASELMYYSLKALVSDSSNDKQKQKKDKFTEKEQEEIVRLLKEKGIRLESHNQPIPRSAFARALIQRFNLSTSFMTNLLGTDTAYYRDAVRLGLFEDNLPAEATLTTQELLRAYLKAEALAK